jgi:hypothetical protein
LFLKGVIGADILGRGVVRQTGIRFSPPRAISAKA